MIPARIARVFRTLLLSLSLVALSAAHADAVDDMVRKQMGTKHIPGVVLAVVKDGKTIKLQGYGFANLEHNIPAKPDSVFRVGSVSKQFVATAILLLVNDGKLSLDDEITKFLSDAPATWNGITVRHLLTHTSGLVREGPAFDRLKIQSDMDVIKSAYGIPLVFKTGERWQYSNLGYFILAEIITKLSGAPWPKFVEDRIFKAAGMSSSSTVNVTAIIPQRAGGYDFDPEKGEYRHAETLLALRPSGAFMTTANDLLKWNAALDSASILGKQAIQTMWTPVKLNSGASYRYGLGWEVTKIGTQRVYWHGGSTPGFRSEFVKLPDQNLAIVLLTNSDTAPIDAMAVLIAQEYVKDLIPNRKVARIATAELEALAGSYRFKSGNVNTVAREGNALRFKSTALELDVKLLPLSSTAFFNEDDPRTVFTFDKSGPAVRVTSYVNDVANGEGVKD